MASAEQLAHLQHLTWGGRGGKRQKFGPIFPSVISTVTLDADAGNHTVSISMCDLNKHYIWLFLNILRDGGQYLCKWGQAEEGVHSQT